MPFIHHTALTLKRHDRAAPRSRTPFTYAHVPRRGRQVIEGVCGGVSCMHRPRKDGRWRREKEGVLSPSCEEVARARC
ncbi:hypothetical protein X777_02259 [Ooceraea biroi]|uniref:Uncharacterized protein n=1 Tax=Ooceraea biroi TaxID=2015173 RepID=A0A026WKW0_OOCBI|nr:hypothetical protein X777_02259 [Ooceraea biroi]